MTPDRYSLNYREKEIKTIARWIEAGDSGTVVGLAGSGKSNLFHFLCRHPEALNPHLFNKNRTIVPIPVDLNNLPAYDLATFYRLILRAFAEASQSFEPNLQQSITEFYQQNRRESDPFLPQSTLRELLWLLKSKKTQVVWLMDRFDYFCDLLATPQMFDTLRGLRDSFKDTLCYIVGTRQEVTYLSNPCHLGSLYELLDNHICWVGPMQRHDALQLIEEETYGLGITFNGVDKTLLLELSGGFPILLKVTCRWWWRTTSKPPLHQLVPMILAEPAIQHRLDEMWVGLTQEEQLALSELEKWHTQAGQKNGQREPKVAVQKAYQELVSQYQPILIQLSNKGLCFLDRGKWCINGKLLSAFVAEIKERGRGRIWYDQVTDEFWQGATRLDLPPQYRVTLHYFLEHTRQPLTKSDLIMAIWPEEWSEVVEDRLYQLIRQLRQKIESNPACPVYIVNWRGKPEGGYQFFPEGRGGNRVK